MILAQASRSAPNPQSGAFLKLIQLDRMPLVKAASGQTVKLMERVPIAEYPDYDPVADLDKLSIRWTQSSGPAAEIEEANTRRARAVLPKVATATELTFDVSIGNASGKRSGKLRVLVAPER